MEDDVSKNLSKQHSPVFGKIAVNKALVTENQLKKAMVEQDEGNLSYKPHRLDGSIDNEKIDIDLNILFKESD